MRLASSRTRTLLLPVVGIKLVRLKMVSLRELPRQLILCGAMLPAGICGVKCWIFKGEVIGHDPMARDKRLASEQPAATRQN